MACLDNNPLLHCSFHSSHVEDTSVHVQILVRCFLLLPGSNDEAFFKNIAVSTSIVYDVEQAGNTPFPPYSARLTAFFAFPGEELSSVDSRHFSDYDEY